MASEISMSFLEQYNFIGDKSLRLKTFAYTVPLRLRVFQY